FVGSVDHDDYYRVSLEIGRASCRKREGLSKDADVQLLNAGGGVIAGSYYGGATPESISRTLDAGVYYVRVYQFSGDTNYNLSVTANVVAPPTPPDYAGNSMAAASDMGTLNGSRFFQDFVGSVDHDDYYRVSL